MEMEGLYQCEANYVPLTPISFLERASFVYGKSPSVIYGDIVYTWNETRDRCVKLASALSLLGINRGEVVAALAPNIPALYELQFGVPMAGAVLSALNTRLDPSTLTAILQLLEPKIIFVDHQFIQIVLEAFNLMSSGKPAPPRLVLIGGKNCAIVPSNTLDYDDLLSLGKPDFKIIHPNDECDPISINFTSGSTGKPKGVVYSHRATYLNSLAVIFRYDMRKMPVFLWTVDMFRCNGWCFPWAVAALGGTNVCLRETTSEVIFHSIVIHKVTHLCGAPILLDKIANSKSSEQRPIPTRVDVIVAGPLPPSEIISKVESFGFDIHHGYGMTEALGPMTDRTLRTNDDDNDERVRIKCREGTHSILMEDVDVKDTKTMISVPSDGKTIGEVVFRGNVVMLGYLKNLQGTQKAFNGGWYRTGDLGIRNPNGDIIMKDRASDSITTKGEIVSTIDIEHVIKSHPFVMEVAVVGKADKIVGEIPSAFVTLKEDCFLSSNDIIKFCEEKLLPRSMVPINVSFGKLPVNSTGKILKYVLREKAKATGSIHGTNGHNGISNPSQ
ncbi:probable acyl-activating enzyme 1, peroxisomal [Cynara cardunculus var. scolymus]|uniref:probable acyl-activating enzyme 1, peroxisomal n=1 Tax=Cynara cardunculus var. scolymus TaxID=59895 RepID=UPI000D6261A4|nr:probable acyl-activating enzyme 1, peroxisomal [Cynara cardunculus var. scolymus]